MAAMSAVSEFPDLIKESFITQELNDAGIFAIRLFIRGKPWVLTIDDEFLFRSTGSQNLYFADRDIDTLTLWGAILEKAWVKIRGGYIGADGGFTSTGVRALTGAPVFNYLTAYIGVYYTADDVFEAFQYANLNNDVMAAGTGGGTDTTFNSCGIA
mmetsp:Transcript_13133/g.22191  ORF Transcript_13133/g.22191 Transcript_13133/m.22191 type:complete len:156 (+) Transcript_13133:481-948(+)